MKYPYTLSAKVAQFPYKFHWNNNWLFRYYFYGLAVSAPFFYWINSIANSPEAKAKHREYLAKQKAEHGHH